MEKKYEMILKRKVKGDKGIYTNQPDTTIIDPCPVQQPVHCHKSFWRRLKSDPHHTAEECPGEGNGSPLQHPCLENLLDRGAWQPIVHGVADSHTTEHTHVHTLVKLCTLVQGYVFLTGRSQVNRLASKLGNQNFRPRTEQVP